MHATVGLRASGKCRRGACFFFCAAPVMSQRWCGNFTQQLSVPEHSPHSHWGLGRWLEDRLKVSKAEAWTMDGEITVHMAYGDFEARDL